MKKVIGIILWALAVSAYAAAPAPSVTFGASVTNANGSLTTTLTWSSQPAGATCTASGSTSWSGTKPASGTLDLPPITMSGTYPLILSCSWAADTQAAITWARPTQNTDGSTLTDLAGYKIYKGLLANGTDQTLLTTVTNPATLAFTATGLAAGQNCFSMTAFNAQNVESAHTPTGCKTNAAGQTASQSVSLTVNPIPGNPGNFTVQ